MTPLLFSSRLKSMTEFTPEAQPMAGRRAASNAEWEKWGELDPLYGVASWEGKGAGHLKIGSTMEPV